MRVKYQSGNFVQVPNLHLVAGMDGSTLAVYVTICRLANSSTGECYPSLVYLADMLDCSQSTIQRSLRELTKLGVIEKTRRIRKDGTRTSNLYTLVVLEEPVVTDDQWIQPQPVVMGDQAINHKKLINYKAPDGAGEKSEDLNNSLNHDGPEERSDDTNVPRGLTVGKYYYLVIKKYGLTVMNHTVIKAKIKQLEAEMGESEALKYLIIFLECDYAKLEYPFKPVLENGLDLYGKRPKFQRYFADNGVKPYVVEDLTPVKPSWEL